MVGMEENFEVFFGTKKLKNPREKKKKVIERKKHTGPAGLFL